MNERIFLSPPHMGDNEINFVLDAFKSNYIAPLGPQVDAFEKEMASYVGSKGALALSSGTSAIHLSLRYLGVTQNDIVFCSSLTFIGSANPILYLGATPVFIDSEPETWNMSPKALHDAFINEKKKGKIPKAVIIVNLYGQSADMEKLLSICNEYKVPVIEDAAESLGASYMGKKSGTFGMFGIFSFNGNKIITTSGGGMIVSQNIDALEKMRFWSSQAKENTRHYQHSECGYNYRMSNILAAIGRGQLRVLDDRVKACRNIFQIYYNALANINGINFMPELSKGKHSRWLTVLTIDPAKINVSCDEIIDALEENNIESRPVWKPLHLQPLFKNCSFYPHENRSVCNIIFKNGICLPSGTSLTEKQQLKVISIIKKVLYNEKSKQLLV